MRESSNEGKSTAMKAEMSKKPTVKGTTANMRIKIIEPAAMLLSPFSHAAMRLRKGQVMEGHAA